VLESAKVLEVSKVLEASKVPEVMHCVLLDILEAVQGGLCLRKY